MFYTVTKDAADTYGQGSFWRVLDHLLHALDDALLVRESVRPAVCRQLQLQILRTQRGQHVVRGVLPRSLRGVLFLRQSPFRAESAVLSGHPVGSMSAKDDCHCRCVLLVILMLPLLMHKNWTHLMSSSLSSISHSDQESSNARPDRLRCLCKSQNETVRLGCMQDLPKTKFHDSTTAVPVYM